MRKRKNTDAITILKLKMLYLLHCQQNVLFTSNARKHNVTHVIIDKRYKIRGAVHGAIDARLSNVFGQELWSRVNTTII